MEVDYYPTNWICITRIPQPRTTFIYPYGKMMLRQQLARAAAQRTACSATVNGAYTATAARRAFSAGAQRKAEVEITIDGKKVMIEQVSNCRASWEKGIPSG